jgi:hypothetical protein
VNKHVVLITAFNIEVINVTGQWHISPFAWHLPRYNIVRRISVEDINVQLDEDAALDEGHINIEGTTTSVIWFDRDIANKDTGTACQ